MKYRVIAYFDLDLEKFNPPMLVPLSLDDTIESLIDSAKKGQIPGQDTAWAYDFGSFDSDGTFDLLEKPAKICDLTVYGRKKE